MHVSRLTITEVFRDKRFDLESFPEDGDRRGTGSEGACHVIAVTDLLDDDVPMEEMPECREDDLLRTPTSRSSEVDSPVLETLEME